MNDISVGSSHRLNLEGLASGGEAVGRLGDLVVFVPYGAPGDDVEVRISELKKNYARGEIFRIFKPSPHRVEPPCPIYYKCGGCQLQHLSYAAQLIYKRKLVQEALEHLGGVRDIRVDDVVESPEPWNYRNKMQVVAASKPFLPPSKKFSLYFGLYAKHTHQVIKMDECAIQHPLNNTLLKAARDIIEKLNWEIYNEKTEKGLLRHLITRVSVSRNEILLTLVTTSTKVPQQAEFVSAITKKIPQLKGIIINKNDRHTNVILGHINKTIWGDDFIMEEIDGIKYRVSQNSFFQVNPPQMENMFKILEEFLNPDHREILLDAYCGVGAISLWLARKFKKVIGIENEPQAKKDALKSASINDIENLEMHTGLVEKILPGIYHKGIRIDKAVLDPPRKGCEEQVLDFIAKMRIRKVVYVSCNPATLARDLARLVEKNYRIESIVPLDMFPQTYHVECIAKLTYELPTFLRKATVKMPDKEMPDKVMPDKEMNEKAKSMSEEEHEESIPGVIDKKVNKTNKFLKWQSDKEKSEEKVSIEDKIVGEKKIKSGNQKKKSQKKSSRKTRTAKDKKDDGKEKKSGKKPKTSKKKPQRKSSEKIKKSKMKKSDKKSGGNPD
ncbi:MAG: 23S rRNA (uracil(1939)-C(5))-methyltransferase RlmD [Candidatus Eremiobacteraeota bacterium]|nr:23S rRNA (uracil(1939)-C(5))-methyltransferase RlmD [Candidatus Eremiobacteraeota bacterium]